MKHTSVSNSCRRPRNGRRRGNTSTVIVCLSQKTVYPRRAKPLTPRCVFYPHKHSPCTHFFAVPRHLHIVFVCRIFVCGSWMVYFLLCCKPWEAVRMTRLNSAQGPKFRCRKCRKLLVTARNIIAMPDDPGGVASFSFRRRTHPAGKAAPTAEAGSLFVEPMRWMTGIHAPSGKLYCPRHDPTRPT